MPDHEALNMISKSHTIEIETNILGIILVLLILLFANMAFYLSYDAVWGNPQHFFHSYMAGLYAPLFHEPCDCDNSRMFLKESGKRPIFIYSMKQNLFSIILASITISSLCLKKYRITCAWFFLLSFCGLYLFHLIFQNRMNWRIEMDFLSEKLLLLIASCISMIIGIRILRLKGNRLFNQEATSNPASPDTRA
jgi:hypothetical protein